MCLVGDKSLAAPPNVRGLADPEHRLPPSHVAFVKGLALRGFGLEQVRAEVEVQVRRVIEAGLRPTHLDSHQHLHVLPGVLEAVIEIAKSAGISVIRLPREAGGALSLRGVQQRLLALFCRRAARRLRKAGMRYPDYFWGFGTGGSLNETNLAPILRRLRSGVNELMCHPGYSDDETRGRYRWGYHWDDETAALKSEGIRRIVDEEGIRLMRFAEAFQE